MPDEIGRNAKVMPSKNGRLKSLLQSDLWNLISDIYLLHFFIFNLCVYFKISVYKICNCTLKNALFIRHNKLLVFTFQRAFALFLYAKIFIHLHFTLSLIFSQRFWKIFFKMMSDVRRRMSEVRFTVGGRYPQSPAIKIEYKKT